jgi:hypothetical protein
MPRLTFYCTLDDAGIYHLTCPQDGFEDSIWPEK